MKMSMKSKMILGCCMAALFLLLQLSRATGITVHLVVNILFFLLVVVHLTVNINVITSMLKNFSKVKKGRLVLYGVLLFAFLLAASTGLLTSELLTGGFGEGLDESLGAGGGGLGEGFGADGNAGAETRGLGLQRGRELSGASLFHRMHSIATRVMLVAVIVHLVLNRKKIASFFNGLGKKS
ncbi:MAG: hypothetical protein FWG00_00715 [Coriobacteriia bacterium]|jgi:hypothetical protein|nr:hypothetical protein [Coriobacteriia bacterium]MDR2714228.1 hypothetical protein [Coriobacteriales bacterium]